MEGSERDPLVVALAVIVFGALGIGGVVMFVRYGFEWAVNRIFTRVSKLVLRVREGADDFWDENPNYVPFTSLGKRSKERYLRQQGQVEEKELEAAAEQADAKAAKAKADKAKAEAETAEAEAKKAAVKK